MKLMDIINDGIFDKFEYYKIKFKSYDSDFDFLTKFNDEKTTGINSTMRYFRDEMERVKKEEYDSRRFKMYPHRPIGDPIRRKIDDKIIFDFNDGRISGRLTFTKLNQYTQEFHKVFKPSNL